MRKTYPVPAHIEKLVESNPQALARLRLDHMRAMIQIETGAAAAIAAGMVSTPSAYDDEDVAASAVNIATLIMQRLGFSQMHTETEA